jgi:hypothetical protein
MDGGTSALSKASWSGNLRIGFGDDLVVLLLSGLLDIAAKLVALFHFFFFCE